MVYFFAVVGFVVGLGVGWIIGRYVTTVHWTEQAVERGFGRWAVDPEKEWGSLVFRWHIISFGKDCHGVGQMVVTKNAAVRSKLDV